MPEVSIIIPMYNEEKYIGSCIDSIIASDLDKSKTEIIIVDGLSTDKSAEIVKYYMQQYPFIKLLTNKRRVIPAAMNIGIKYARGEYIIRIDAHSVYPKDYFSKLLYWSKKLDADNVGGVCITDVREKSRKTNAIKAVMSHKLGVGGGAYRGAVDKPIASHTVPFGCFKKSTLQKYGYFDERLERTEDLEINRRLLDRGGKVYLVPGVSFTYFARQKLRDVAKKSYETGKWIVLNACFTKSFKSLHMYHFIPLLFVLSLIVPCVLSLIYSKFCIISLISFTIYTTAICTVGLRMKSDNTSFIYIVLTFFMLHISYGIGSMVGLYKSIAYYLRGK